MAKSKSKNRGREVTTSFANRRLPPAKTLLDNKLFAFLKPQIKPVPFRELVKAVEDRRLYHPLGPHKPAMATQRSAAKLAVLITKRTRFVSPVVKFDDPIRVALCVRRKERREVLHAKGIAGRKGLRSPRFNWFSKIKC